MLNERNRVAYEMIRVVTMEAIEHLVPYALIVINGIVLNTSVLSYMVALLMPTLFTLMRFSLNSLVAYIATFYHSYWH